MVPLVDVHDVPVFIAGIRRRAGGLPVQAVSAWTPPAWGLRCSAQARLQRGRLMDAATPHGVAASGVGVWGRLGSILIVRHLCRITHSVIHVRQSRGAGPGVHV